MFKQLKSYYYIHFKYCTLEGCGNCLMNRDEAKRLKKEFKELEDREAVMTEFEKGHDRAPEGRLQSEGCRIENKEAAARSLEQHHKQPQQVEEVLLEDPSAEPADAPIAALLTSLRLDKYHAVLAEQEVDMEALALMDEGDLKELGLPKGPRVKLLHASRISAAHDAVAVDAFVRK